MSLYQKEQSFSELVGHLHATETIDLTMVSSIGFLLRSKFGNDVSLPWVDIHIKEEPEHVENSNAVLFQSNINPLLVKKSASEMLEAWDGLFKECYARLKVQD